MLACGICLAASAQSGNPQGGKSNDSQSTQVSQGGRDAQGGKELTPEQKAQKREQRAAQLESEKIAFITKAVDITPEEAGPFWALYNKLEKDQKALVAAEKEAFKGLNIALRAKNEDGTPSTPDAEIEKLLKVYLDAKKANTDVHVAHLSDYKKIVGARKAASFYSAQERFRRQQIKKLANPGGQHGGQGGRGAYGGGHGGGYGQGGYGQGGFPGEN